MEDVRLVKILQWCYPIYGYGNVHTMPYGKLLVTDGIDTKVCSTKGDKIGDNDGYQYITFKRKRYKVVINYAGYRLLTYCNKDGINEFLKIEPIKKLNQ